MPVGIGGGEPSTLTSGGWTCPSEKVIRKASLNPHIRGLDPSRLH